LNGLFIRSHDTYGGTGGANTHTPANQTVTTGGPSGATQYTYGGVDAGANNHTHDMTVSFTEGDNTPPYIDVIFAKYITIVPYCDVPRFIAAGML